MINHMQFLLLVTFCSDGLCGVACSDYLASCLLSIFFFFFFLASPRKIRTLYKSAALKLQMKGY